jgi:8-oxo-dGTP pyrophosphatase MutT (NUDIX family)
VWPRRSSRQLADYRLFRLRADSCVSPRTGVEHEFLVLETSDWVNVIALTDRDQVVLIRQFRCGRATVSLEIPGGLIDPGEPPAEAAARELLEETGYQADRWTALGTIEPNPAILSNLCHTFLAEGCRRTRPPALDEREDISVEERPLAEVPALLARGEITHALVGVAFQKLELLRRGLLVPG